LLHNLAEYRRNDGERNLASDIFQGFSQTPETERGAGTAIAAAALFCCLTMPAAHAGSLNGDARPWYGTPVVTTAAITPACLYESQTKDVVSVAGEAPSGDDADFIHAEGCQMLTKGTKAKVEQIGDDFGICVRPDNFPADKHCVWVPASNVQYVLKGS
jgi:hypothetical protein